MNKLITLVVMALMIATAVVATETTLDPSPTTMGYVDEKIATYCLFDGGVPQDVLVVVDPVCRDLNNLLGCSPGDEYNPTGFSVIPLETTTGADGCVELNITSNLDEGNAGVFWYTVNGEVAPGYYVGAETGKVFIPEFTTIGAGLVLLGAGLYSYRKRK